jgi:uncharacterized membrane protein
MRSKWFDMIAVMAATIVIMLLTLTGALSGLWQLPFALPMVFLLPGYALLSAISPRHRFRRTEQVVLSIGLSIMLLILGGFLLNWTPWGLQARTWTVGLGALTLVACVVALVRRTNGPTFSPLIVQTGLTVGQGMLLALTVVIAALAWTIAHRAAEVLPPSHFTQLWILPAEGQEQGAVEVGIYCMEADTTRYTLQVSVGGAITRWPVIELEPDESWEVTVNLPETADAEYVHAELYRLDAQGNEPYRRVTLWRTIN